jgi:hypothetical protein
MASNAQGIRAGKAYVEVGANDSLLQRGLKAAEARVKAFGTAVTTLGQKFLKFGTLLGAPLLGAAKLFADAGSELADMSSRTGMSVEALSQLQYAAQQTGTDLAGIEAGARKMQKGLVDAVQGSDEARVAFESLGLSVDGLMKLNPDQQFQAIARAIGYIQDPTAKAAASMKVFGKSGTALLPMIDDLDALTGKARELGLVMSTADANAADALGDAMDTLGATLKKVAINIGAALAPVLTDLSEWLATTVSHVSAWIRENQGLIKILAAVAVGVVGIGAAMVALGTVATGLASALGLIASTLAALATPLGFAAVLATAATVAFVKFTDTGKAAFEGLLATVKQAMKGIGDALAAGDVALAGKILWLSLRMEWEKGVGFLQGKWLELVGFLRGKFEEFTRWFAGALTDLWATVQAGWSSLFELGDLDAKLKEIEENRQNAQRALDDQKEAADRERQEQQDKAAAGVEARMASIRQEWQDALDAAEKARDTAAAAGFGDLSKMGKKPGRPGTDLAELDNAVQSAQRKVDVSGSFSADALKGLGIGDSVANDQLKEQKKQTKELERLNSRIRNAALVFQD